MSTREPARCHEGGTETELALSLIVPRLAIGHKRHDAEFGYSKGRDLHSHIRT